MLEKLERLVKEFQATLREAGILCIYEIYIYIYLLYYQVTMNYKIRKRQTKNIYIVFLTYISDSLHLTSYFGPRVYPLGSLVIALVRPSVCQSVCPSVFEYLGDRSLVFSETSHEVRGH